MKVRIILVVVLFILVLSVNNCKSLETTQKIARYPIGELSIAYLLLGAAAALTLFFLCIVGDKLIDLFRDIFSRNKKFSD